MRLFVGLAISEDARETLERLTLHPTGKAGGDPGLRLHAKDDGVRWSTPEQWHVTLVFLGEVEDAAREALIEELRRVRQPALTLRMEQVGVFERAGILHAQMEVTPALLRLYEAVGTAVKRCGLAVEERPYRAHITLARAQNREGRKTIERLGRAAEQQRLGASWRAEEFLLYESQLSPGGSRYVVRERFGLKAETGTG